MAEACIVGVSNARDDLHYCEAHEVLWDYVNSLVTECPVSSARREGLREAAALIEERARGLDETRITLAAHDGAPALARAHDELTALAARIRALAEGKEGGNG